MNIEDKQAHENSVHLDQAQIDCQPWRVETHDVGFMPKYGVCNAAGQFQFYVSTKLEADSIVEMSRLLSTPPAPATKEASGPTDTEMLDWLEKNGHELHICCWKGVGAETNPWTIHRGDFVETDAIGEMDTFRQTIAQAMQAAPKEDRTP